MGVYIDQLRTDAYWETTEHNVSLIDHVGDYADLASPERTYLVEMYMGMESQYVPACVSYLAALLGNVESVCNAGDLVLHDMPPTTFDRSLVATAVTAVLLAEEGLRYDAMEEIYGRETTERPGKEFYRGGPVNTHYKMKRAFPEGYYPYSQKAVELRAYVDRGLSRRKPAFSDHKASANNVMLPILEAMVLSQTFEERDILLKSIAVRHDKEYKRKHPKYALETMLQQRAARRLAQKARASSDG